MNPERFNILSLDGASVTGGAGWLSIGLLRDHLHTYLQISDKAHTDHAEALAALSKFYNANPNPKAFCGGLASLQQHLSSWPNGEWFPLWYYASKSYTEEGPPNHRPGPPLPIKIATMRLAMELMLGSDHRKSEIMDELQQIAQLERNEWRAEASAGHGWMDFLKALSIGISPTATMLFKEPSKFLLLRWVTGSALPSGLATHLDSCLTATRTWIQADLLDNPLLGDSSRIDLIAGTSSGGLNAMVLAKHERLVDGIEEALAMWSALADSASENGFGSDPTRLVKALMGQTSFGGQVSEEVYQKHFGGGLTMRDLQHAVVITSVQLDSGDHNTIPTIRRWSPVLFQNLDSGIAQRSNKRVVDGIPLKARVLNNSLLGIRQTPENGFPSHDDLSLISLARSTSTLPIMGRVHAGLTTTPPDKQKPSFTQSSSAVTESGFIDGGFYANNPSMAAVSLALNRGYSIKNLAVYSLGNGRQGRDFVTLDDYDLGYGSWLLSNQRKALMFDLVLDCGIDAVNAYCSGILGSAHISDQFERDPELEAKVEAEQARFQTTLASLTKDHQSKLETTSPEHHARLQSEFQQQRNNLENSFHENVRKLLNHHSRHLNHAGFVKGRYLRAEVWTDRQFMKDTMAGQAESSMDFRIDEALGLYRYVYNPAELFTGFFTACWG